MVQKEKILEFLLMAYCPHLTYLCLCYICVTVYKLLIPWHREIMSLVHACVPQVVYVGSIARPQAQGLGWASRPREEVTLGKPLCHPLSALDPAPGSLWKQVH